MNSGKDADNVDSGVVIRERTIRIDNRNYIVCEIEKTSDLVDDWIQNQMASVDPFGVVLWPASQVLAGRIAADPLSFRGKSVMELGAGTGLCSIVAASAGASVLATDTNPLTLQLLESAAERQGLTLRTELFDITGRPARSVVPGRRDGSRRLPRLHAQTRSTANHEQGRSL